MQRLTATVFAMLLAISGVMAQEAPQQKDDGSYLQICLKTAADMSPIYPTDVLPADVNMVYAAFRLSPEESYQVLASRWVAVDVGNVAPPNTVIARFDYRLEGRTASDFKYSQTGPMPPGKYRLETEADGKPWKTAEFTVLSRPENLQVTLREMRDLVPVQEGKTWNYDFVQQGINVNIPGIEPDAEGRLHAKVSVTVAATEAAGIRVETRRNDHLILEEWWRVTEGGIFTIRTRQPGDINLIYTPPLCWIPFPPQTGKGWKYIPQSKAYEQLFSTWGPVRLQGPSGEAPGYIVVSDQKIDALNRLTTERHYIPGVGMVRETVISAFNNEMLRRQDTTLEGLSAAPTTAP